MREYENPAARAVQGVELHGLVTMADVASPDTSESAGALFLLGVRDALAESLQWANPADAGDLDRFRDGDSVHEVADGAPNVYTAERWRQFTDLAVWDRASELATGGEDMTTLAGYVLYEVAEALVFELLGAAAEAFDDEAAED